MKAPRTALLTAVVAIFALPAPALAEYLVPPGNSAVNQYTESVPTAGGHRGVREGGRDNPRSPNEVLGRDNAQRLEAHGEDGREAAEVAAETAPVTTTVSPEAEPEGADDGDGTAAGAGGGGGGAGNGSGQNGGTGREQPATASPGQVASGGADTRVEVGGSSGLGEVLAQATGSSSGQLGLLLPLIVLGVAAWAVAFLLRQRKQPTP